MGWLHCARAQVSTQFLYHCGWRFSGWRFGGWRFSGWWFSGWRFSGWRFSGWWFRSWRFSGWRFEGGSRAVFDWRSAGDFRLAVFVWRFIACVLLAVCGRFAGGLRAVCGRFVDSLRADCGWRFAGGLRVVCRRFAGGSRPVSLAAGFVCRFAFGGWYLSVCVLRFAFDSLRLAVCAWRIAGGFADGLRADCCRFCGRFTVGSLRAVPVCERQAGGCRPICGWRFAATIN